MKILLVDDHPLYLEGLENLLRSRSMNVIGTARDGAEALSQARALRPDVILMDIQMSTCDGLTATRMIKAELPDIKIVMLTLASDDDNLFQAIKSGAFGYLVKTLDTAEFFAALEMLERGETPLSRGLAQRILQELARSSPALDTGSKQPQSDPNELSTRQVNVLRLVAQGLTYKEVGAQLGLSERTVKYHMGEIVQRLHLENRVQVIAFAKRHQLDR